MACSWPMTYSSSCVTISRGDGNAGEELLAGAAAAAFLVEDRLAQLDALAADVNVARSFDQRADVAIALATERTEGVLLGGAASAAAATAPADVHFSPVGHANPFQSYPAGSHVPRTANFLKRSLEWLALESSQFRPGASLTTLQSSRNSSSLGKPVSM